MFDIPRLPMSGDNSGDNSVGHGVPELVLESNGRTWTLDPSRAYTLGRDPQGDVVFDDARVSWRHATVSFNGRSWVIEDHGSTNGTFVQGQRIHHMELGPGSAVNLGNATDGPLLNLSGAAASVATPQAQPQQQPYAAQGANPGWAQQAPHQQQAPQAGFGSSRSRSSSPAGTSRSSRAPAGPRGRRLPTATAAPPRSTSSRSAA